MQDDRPWHDLDARLRVLTPKEPELQKHLGMQRQCEHDLVVRLVEEHKPHTYVELGSGNGLLLARVKEALPEARVIGFEYKSPKQVVAKCKNLSIDLRSQDILGDGGKLLGQQVKKFIEECDGPIVIYTDNGNKPTELAIVSEHMRPGDICGSHDFSGPDWTAFVGFLKKRNFATLKNYEPYILEHLCLQRFWMKQEGPVSENPCARFEG